MPARVDTLREWLALHPPPDAAFTQTLAGVAARVEAGEPFWPAVREFRDEFSLRPGATLQGAAIAQAPVPTADRRSDAYLAALAEHLAVGHGLDRPPWCLEPDRFLDAFWFVVAEETFGDRLDATARFFVEQLFESGPQSGPEPS